MGVVQTPSALIIVDSPLSRFLEWFETQPGLGLIGALALLAILFIPLALRLAGLTGVQIVDVIRLTLQFFVNIAAGLRDENKNGKPPA